MLRVTTKRGCSYRSRSRNRTLQLMGTGGRIGWLSIRSVGRDPIERRKTVRRTTQGLAISAMAIVLAGCGGSGSAIDIEVLNQDPELVAVGADLYATACGSCHGDDLRGTDRGPSHLSEVYEPNHHADAAFLLAVRRGVAPHHWSFGPMPPIEGLTDDDVNAIVAFVRDVQGREGFESYPP